MAIVVKRVYVYLGILFLLWSYLCFRFRKVRKVVQSLICNLHMNVFLANDLLWYCYLYFFLSFILCLFNISYIFTSIVAQKFIVVGIFL